MSDQQAVTVYIKNTNQGCGGGCLKWLLIAAAVMFVLAVIGSMGR